MPENGRGVMFIGYEKTETLPSKAFASKDNTNGWPAPTMSLDYYLPVNPGWVTQMLVLPGVGTSSLDVVNYATNAGLAGDIELYGSSKTNYGGKQWRVATGDFTEAAGFSDHYGWNLTNTIYGVGTNTCTLFNLYVFSDTAASGCYLRCGSGDGVRLIVNNTVVGTDDATTRTWAMDQSVFGPFSLDAGWNRVLLKVRRGTGTTGLKAVRFSNADATVWSGSTLRFAVDDTAAPGNPTGCTESGGAVSGQWQNASAAPSFGWAGAADIAATDEGASGIRGYKVYYGASANGAPGVFQTNAAYAPSAQAEGLYYLRVSTVDNALNESQAVTLFAYACDRTPPTGVGVGFSSATPNSITVTGTGTDAVAGIDAGRGYVYHFGASDSGQQGASYTWTGLVPNTQYSDFSVTVSDKAGNAATSGTQSKWTLSVPPGVGSVAAGDSSPCANSPVPWTAPGGFGAGAVQYYRYAWDQAVSHQWTGSEAQWAGGTLSTTPATGGTWYLHIQGYNGEHVANGHYDYAIAVNASPVPQPKTLSTWKNKSATITVGKLLAGATGASSVAGVSTTTAGASVGLAEGVVTYVPPTEFTGTDTFTFTLISSAGCYGKGTVTVTVSAGNGQSPNAVYTGTEGNDFVARFAGIPGETYTIEASKWAEGPWHKLGTNVVVPSTDQGWGVGVFELRDPATNGLGFYRTVWPAY